MTDILSGIIGGFVGGIGFVLAEHSSKRIYRKLLECKSLIKNYRAVKKMLRKK